MGVVKLLVGGLEGEGEPFVRVKVNGKISIDHAVHKLYKGMCLPLTLTDDCLIVEILLSRSLNKHYRWWGRVDAQLNSGLV